MILHSLSYYPVPVVEITNYYFYVKYLFSYSQECGPSDFWDFRINSTSNTGGIEFYSSQTGHNTFSVPLGTNFFGTWKHIFNVD